MDLAEKDMELVEIRNARAQAEIALSKVKGRMDHEAFHRRAIR